jgi:hypothetical protein
VRHPPRNGLNCTALSAFKERLMPWLGVLVFASGVVLPIVLHGPGWLGLGLLLSFVGGTWAVLALADARITGSARDEHVSDSQLQAWREMLRQQRPPDEPPTRT